jgi:hypothetical protein
MKPAVLVAVAVASLAPITHHADPAPPVAGRAPGRSAARPSLPLQQQVAHAVFPRERWQKLVSDASAELTQKITLNGVGRYELAPEFADRLREEYEKLAPYEEMVAFQARVLGYEYSRAELRKLLQFLQSPLGKKSVVLIQDLSTASAVQLQLRMHEGMEAALGRLVSLVRPVGGGSGDGAEAPEGDQAQGSGGEAPPAPDSSTRGEESELL